ncbi:hypothetical protein G7Y89_g13629 [Cudoniella acicularis]|uniref:Uncharacterized protein n=1 Tax=Cudoniella acicularis TaxID=354080 RepID=A0A8H4VW87_9HELO|nr:hypothetical protein G7Y89_g13629 [Cudoniella acicularis]
MSNYVDPSQQVPREYFLSPIYVFLCGHRGTGPTCRSMAHPPHQPDNQYMMQKMHHLYTKCPFCDDDRRGYGAIYKGIFCFVEVFSVQMTYQTHPVSSIQYTRPGPFESVTENDWSWGFTPAPQAEQLLPNYTGPVFRHATWVPRPVGTVHLQSRPEGAIMLNGGQDGSPTVLTRVSNNFKHRVNMNTLMAQGAGSVSSFAGMASQLSAALLSGEMAGRNKVDEGSTEQMP